MGKILNTNAQYIAERSTSLGGRVCRITTVGDNLEAIAESVKEALNRKPHMIIITGGLGPTFDNKTLEGVSLGLNRGLSLNEGALSLIRAKYRVTQELPAVCIKMAMLPEHAKALRNPVGTAPGVLIDESGTYVVCLPGVPREMKAIFEESVALIIASLSTTVFYEKAVKIEGAREAEIAHFIENEVKEAGVHIKSHPRVDGLVLHFSIFASNAEDARRKVEHSVRRVVEFVASQGR